MASGTGGRPFRFRGRKITSVATSTFLRQRTQQRSFMRSVECVIFKIEIQMTLSQTFFSDGNVNKFIINVFVRPNGDETVLLRKRKWLDTL